MLFRVAMPSASANCLLKNGGRQDSNPARQIRDCVLPFTISSVEHNVRVETGVVNPRRECSCSLFLEFTVRMHEFWFSEGREFKKERAKPAAEYPATSQLTALLSDVFL